MQLVIEDRRTGGKIPLSLETFYRPPWGRELADIVTFEGFNPAFKGAEAADLKLNGYLLETDSRGWVVGCRQTLRLPQSRFLNFADLLHRVWPKHEAEWVHSGVTPQHPLIDVIGDGLPGAGMVIVRNLSALTAVSLGGTHLEQEGKKRAKDRETLLALGFVER
ncbi:hypothetical protein [Deinococcus sp. S9]|uniref:hypothetical protein n=1 Tax=Deinococcus sp. S9 TaxID=2545754 RepID=UPI0010556295|nr:hypothetical protein [Deinococcus sp. S9]TDE87382.1 hypothetical protein E0686_02495 [Deinococcus sp. S9]